MSIVRPAAPGRELLARLAGLIDRQRAGAARPLFNAVRALAAPDAEVADLEARLLLLEGDADGACAVLDAAVARAPTSAQLRMARAIAREQAGDGTGAARDAAEAVVLDPADARAKALLGAYLHRLGRHAEAAACLGEAVAMVPGDGAYRRHLAAAQSALGDEAAAGATLEQGLALSSGDVALRTAAILARMRRGDFAGAEAMALAAGRAGVADASVLGLLGHARSSLGRHAEAAEAYAEARKLAPEDPYVAHLAAAGGLAPDTGRCTTDYVRVVFDGYASRFDDHLMALGYRIPGLIRTELAGVGGAAGPVLDIGCGTGLVAVAAADAAAGPWIGVDLSPAMLAEASKRGLYQELHEADIATFLERDDRDFPTIVAGDVMPYLGDLTPWLRGVAGRLAKGGRFLFSAERLDDADARSYRLGRLGRYAHTDGHVAAAAGAAGLTVAAMRPEPIRLEGGVPVPGLFVVLELRAAP
jgi:predicted TPR repeat methyltransferase